MKNSFLVKATTLVAGIIALSVASARAAFELTISDGVHTAVTIMDNGTGDLNKTTGAIEWIGSIGIWSLNFDLGLSKPIIGSPSQAEMDLGIVSASSKGTGSLTITLSDTGFTPLSKNAGIVTFSMGGTSTGGTIKGSAGVDGTTVASIGPLGVGSWNKTTLGGATDFGSTYSLEETVVITHSGSTKTTTSGDIDMMVQPVPEPTTVIAGLMLLLPFGWCALRKFRKSRVTQS